MPLYCSCRLQLFALQRREGDSDCNRAKYVEVDSVGFFAATAADCHFTVPTKLVPPMRFGTCGTALVPSGSVSVAPICVAVALPRFSTVTW